MTEPIRVLHVMNDLRVGGGQQFVLNLMSNADPSQVRPSICYLEPAEEMEQAFLEAGFRPVALDHRGGALSIRTVRRLVGLIRRERIQVLHAHSSLDKHYAQLAGLVTGVPVVSHLHMPYDYGAETSLKARLRALVRRVGGRLSVKHFIAVSGTVWDAHKEHVPGGGARISLIPNGIPTARFAHPPDPSRLRAIRHDLGLDDATHILVNVGALRGHKNQRVLPPMMSIVRGRFPGARMLIVGEGDERTVLEREIARAGEEGSVSILGTRHDIEHLLALGDVFVFPSRAEGYGLALAEAMAAGKPSVVSNLPVHAELIEHGVTGLLVDPTPAALADAVLGILDDPARARAMGAAAQRFAIERCDLAVCARRIAEVYESVAARDGRRP